MPPKPRTNRGGGGQSPNPPPQTQNLADPPAPPQSQAESSSQAAPQAAETGAAPKKKRHRAGKKRRNRRQSFAAPSDTTEQTEPLAEGENLSSLPEAHPSSSFYRLGSQNIGSNTSLDSEALLDHREQDRNPARPRRQSSHQQSLQSGRPVQGSTHTSTFHRHRGSLQVRTNMDDPGTGDSAVAETTDRTPLMSSHRQSTLKNQSSGYGGLNSAIGSSRRPSNRRMRSSSSISPARQMSTQSIGDEYDVNNPPSIPGSPRLGPNDDYDDFLLPEFTGSPDTRRTRPGSQGREAIIDIDNDASFGNDGNYTASPDAGYFGTPRRRPTGASPVEDVCIPFEQMTEIAEEDEMQQQEGMHKHRRHKTMWPDLTALEEWCQVEKEERTQEGIRAKKVNEPVVVGGRLRPQKGAWRREAEEAPFRWTYFNDEMDTSLRSHTISGLQQLGHNFRELFIPDPPEIDVDSSDEEDVSILGPDRSGTPVNGQGSRATTRQSSVLGPPGTETKTSSGTDTPSKIHPSNSARKRYGPRPVFWLDVLQPTWEEMRVLSRAFGIHKLTAEDIMEQEAREKVELFRTYYFVNYRTFEQDDKNEDYLDPVNMYFVVFKGGVISFHFSQMPHPPNVRRRIRQLAEHQFTDSDWISYAIIDNITDAYAPLIEQIEKEVDEIDDEILQLNSREQTVNVKPATKAFKDQIYEKLQEQDQTHTQDSGRDMLLRVGECRKRVMGLYRLLGNKADVIKGLAKRCNEQWQVAPRSDVGLYLGDIQDHIITMTGNLTHYENILSRAHSNYLAQINIGMNERAEKTADVLGKLTVLGTIVLPMNVITGLWGMNCLVPGQVEDNPDLIWFFCLTGFLLCFGLMSFFVAKKVYKIV